MRQKGKFILAGLAIVAGAFLLIEYAASGRKQIPDRVVQGKLISVRVKEALASDSYYEFTQVLNSVGAEAVPYIIPALEAKDSRLNAAWVKWWAKLPKRMQGWFDQPSLARDKRMRAVVLLREMGPPGKDAVPALIGRLSDTDGTIRLHSAITLGNIGPDAVSAVPALEPLLKDKGYNTRVYAAIAVWKITKRAEPSLTVLKEGLKVTNAPFRWAAAVFLGEMGPAACDAIPLLEETIKDSGKEVESVSIQSLAEISADTTPFLISLLADPDPAIRISAAVALGKLGPQARAAVPMLKNALSDHARGAPMIMGRSNGPKEVSASAKQALQLIEAGSSGTSD